MRSSHMTWRITWAAASMAVVLAFIPGCGLLGITPPYQAEGTYSGAWNGEFSGGLSMDAACSARLSIFSDEPDALYGRKLEGSLSVFFTCADLLDAIAEQGLPGRITLDVTGSSYGFDRLSFSGVYSDKNITETVSFTGNGDDTDGDGMMDTFTGRLTIVVEQSGYKQITLSADWEAVRVS
ncbi:MAG TPA: hypothetical protein PLH06_06790 [Candidatus Hydrogenedentes bacterium]|nr:hypothetical protein [Candidatus Hydrogenedentota bacterium]